jgi:hypothetical protein
MELGNTNSTLSVRGPPGSKSVRTFPHLFMLYQMSGFTRLRSTLVRIDGPILRPFCLLSFCLLAGCGSTKQNTATEQLLMSNAIDATISKLDFSVLTDKKVFLDTTYINKPPMVAAPVPPPMAIDANYIVSSIRQQMFAAGVHLVDTKEDADIIAEPRVGALGLDGHDVTYGIPASSALSSASSAVTGTSLIPAIPELSMARKEDRLGAAKVAVFAYDRKTRQPIWQSGVAQSNSDSKATWVLGIGPFQRGSIRSGTQFAGSKVGPSTTSPAIQDHESLEEYLSSRVFEPESPLVKHASHEQNGVATSKSDTAAAQAPASTPAAIPPATTPPQSVPPTNPPTNPPPATTPPASSPPTNTPPTTPPK